MEWPTSLIACLWASGPISLAMIRLRSRSVKRRYLIAIGSKNMNSDGGRQSFPCPLCINLGYQR
jgi:hypothetical protein